MAIIHQYSKATDTTYVYESQSYWVPELGQSRSRRKLLGKLDPVTGELVPCGKRGPKKKQPETDGNEVSSGEYDNLLRMYEQSQAEVTRLRLSLAEKEKDLSDLRKQNQRLANVIEKVQALVTE